jgi:hypothetical protein
MNPSSTIPLAATVAEREQDRARSWCAPLHWQRRLPHRALDRKNADSQISVRRAERTPRKWLTCQLETDSFSLCIRARLQSCRPRVKLVRALAPATGPCALRRTWDTRPALSAEDGAANAAERTSFVLGIPVSFLEILSGEIKREITDRRRPSRRKAFGQVWFEAIGTCLGRSAIKAITL